jgi:peptidylprolyl isomerase/FKBP-type peptidyl-prolyl cis-trans isomerase SlpA
MSQAKNGDAVKVHFTGRLENGEIFGKSDEDQPFEFTLGESQIITGVEQGILGMEVGEKKTVEVPPEQAYGPKRDELFVEVKKSDLPEGIEPAVGDPLRIRNSDGSDTRVFIADIGEDTVTLDGNHPLAGLTLFFDLELVEIV